MFSGAPIGGVAFSELPAAAGGGIVTVTIVSRAGRARSADTVAPMRSVAVVSRAGRARSADATTTISAVAVTSRAGRVRSSNQAAPSGITIVNIASRAGRARGAVACSTTRAVVIAARVGHLRTADAVTPSRAVTITSRAGRVRSADNAANSAGNLVVVNVVTRAGRVRGRVTASHQGPAGTLVYDPRFDAGDPYLNFKTETEMPTFLSAKDPSETRVVTFGYGREFPGATITAPTLTSTVWAGTDSTPSAFLTGAAQVSGQDVLQAVHDGVAFVDYHLSCSAMVNGVGPVIRTAILPVRNL